MRKENYKNDKLINPHHITTASFNKTPSASEVPLTSHMLKVAKISEPEKSLLLSSREVNSNSVADKSLSRTAVQSTTKEAVVETKHVEESGATADIIESLDASKPAEVVRSLPKTAAIEKDAESDLESGFDDEFMSISGDEDELADSDKELSAADEIEATNVFDEILTEINTKDTTTLVFIAPSTRFKKIKIFSALGSDPLVHLPRRIDFLTTHVYNLGKSLPDKFDNKIDSVVPRMVVDALEESQVKMDDPDITMEEYIQVEVEKARRHSQAFNWETATYAKVRCFGDID
ncbi:hypothetical protein Tco_0798995 [Tanacetum coccineum]